MSIRHPTHPAVPHEKADRHGARHLRRAQALQPSAQQGRGLHLGREDAPGRAHEGLHPQPRRPGAHGVGPEVAQPAGHRAGGARLAVALPKAADEGRQRLGVRQVQPAAPGQQELAPGRGHGVEHRHRHTGARQHLGGHQAGGAGADDGDGISRCVGHRTRAQKGSADCRGRRAGATDRAAGADSPARQKSAPPRAGWRR